LKEQTQGFTETQQELKAEADASESSFAKLLQNVTKYFAAYLSFEKIKDFFQGVVDETNKADEASAQLFNTLENAGRTDLFETLSKQADDFAKSYKAIESTDVKSVFTKLIDYGKLTQAQITSLTDVIINYAQKQKISLPEATDIFTRALEGNTKELKTYGINMRDASTVTQRLQLLLGPLADKVSGAESAFEKTNSGALSTFKENIKRLQITIGEFAEDLVSMKDAADKANDSFDKAKAETDSYNQSLGPLLQRYDELKSKTHLNKSEHEELQGIIQQIVTILPSAASSFDQYGNAIDINRQKVDDFLQSNAKFLAQKEYAAVDEITQRVLRTVGEIKKQSDELSKHQITLFEGGGGTGGGGGQIVTRTSTLDEEKEQLAFLRTNQEQLLKDANTLSEKYGQTLPAGVQKAVETIKAEFDSIKDAQDKAQQYSKNLYNTQIKAFDDEIAQIKKGLNNLDVNSDAFKKESEVIKQLQKEEDDLKKQRDNVNKKIGNGNPDKLSKADADKYAALLKEAQDFYKQIQYLAQEDDAINQGEREKEIEDVKIKYQKLLDQANNYYKEHVTSLAQFKKEEAIIEKASDDEVAALRKKFKDEDDKVFTEQFAKKSDDEFKLAVKLSDQYYAEQKSAAAENYKDGLINQAEYDQQIYDIDQKALQARIVIANDYLKTSKDAADALADYTKQSADNTTKFLEQQAKAREDFNVKEVEAIVKQRQIEINDPSTPASTKAEAQRGNANDEAAAALKNLQDELQKQGKAFDIASASATEQGKAIWLEYAATMKQIDEDLLKTRIDNIAQYADYTKQALTSINTIITNAENKQLAKEQADNTAKQASLQKMLNNKLISQKQYDAQTQALTDDADAKSKKIQREQAKRQKALDLFQATIDVAEGIAAALKTPWLIPVIATLGALQIAAIASEPLPTAGRGKLLTQGPSHQERDKGLHVVNPR
ncbi:MAG TPA: hypothetical protein VHA52_01735, partial [Candidatus Babeliaceae bacterium]|nr:hypothetical protein [Candidatus Babeliaceae bacterium]